jgi:cell division protein FtsZ
MKGMGSAMMGSGEASGEDRAIKAAELALQNPLLGNLRVASAKGMLVNITGGANLSLYDVRRRHTFQNTFK